MKSLIQNFLYNNLFIYFIRYIYSYLISQKKIYKEMYEFRINMGFTDFDESPIALDKSFIDDKKDN